MSIVIGIRNNGTTYIGYDSVLTSGNNKIYNSVLDSKVMSFIYKDGCGRPKNLFIGVVGPHKIQNIIKYELNIDARDFHVPLDTYIYKKIVLPLKSILSEHNLELSQLLVIAENRIFIVWNDFSVSEIGDDFYAIGSGGLVAKGALAVASLIYKDIRPILDITFKACAKYINNVGGNFYSINTETGKIDLHEIETLQ